MCPPVPQLISSPVTKEDLSMEIYDQKNLVSQNNPFDIHLSQGIVCFCHQTIQVAKMEVVLTYVRSCICFPADVRENPPTKIDL